MALLIPKKLSEKKSEELYSSNYREVLLVFSSIKQHEIDEINILAGYNAGHEKSSQAITASIIANQVQDLKSLLMETDVQI